MQPRRFRAATLEAAYEQIRDALGDDAVILGTQSVRVGGVLGVGGRAEVEVLATLPADPPSAAPFDTAPFGAAPFGAAPFNTAPFNTAPFDAAPSDSAPFGAERSAADRRGAGALVSGLAAHDALRRVAEVDAQAPAEAWAGAPEPGLVGDAAWDAVELAPPFANPIAGSAARRSAARADAAPGDLDPVAGGAAGGRASGGPFDAYLRAQGFAGFAVADGSPAAAFAAPLDAHGAALPFGTRAADAPAWRPPPAPAAAMRRPGAPPLPPPPADAYGAAPAAAEELPPAPRGDAAAAPVPPSAEHPGGTAPAPEMTAEPEMTAAPEMTAEPEMTAAPEMGAAHPALALVTAQETALGAVGDRLAALDRAVGRIERHVAAEALGRGPAALRALHQALIDGGMRAPALLPVLDRLAETLATDATAAAVAAAVERRLAAQLPAVVRPPLARAPHALVLAGPAGSGKTTAAARLALQLAREHGLRVVLAGTDVERAGAPQQLEAIGVACEIEVRPCYTPADLQALLAEEDIDLVVVDTPGQSGHRRDRLAELGAFLRVVERRTLLLTLPATMQASDLLRLTEAMRPLQPAGLIVTRCDEASAFGGVYSAAFESKLGVAWTAHSAQLGDPLRPGDHHALAGAVVRGAWDRPATRLVPVGGGAGAARAARRAAGLPRETAAEGSRAR